MKKRRAARKEAGLCVDCGIPLNGPSTCRCIECVVYDNEKHAKSYENRKRIVYEAYGGAFCACCGEDNYKFLSIDHINNNGAEHRRQLKGKTRSTKHMCSWLIKNNFPSGFQVLCANCNWGKHANKGICPHKKSPYTANHD
jgi:hypothetical protein